MGPTDFILQRESLTRASTRSVTKLSVQIYVFASIYIFLNLQLPSGQKILLFGE